MYQRRPSFVNHPPQDFSRASLKKGKWGNLKASIDESKCTACGACADICPAGAIIINSRARVDAALCTGCGACVQACANGAISLMEQ
ncbi:MAG: 4Fe-4S binding protein [Candidatus Omnitrophica bacterium]|nr:4Fe-4S binding protein [Candidatus Omnitrophota bacterium]